MCFSATASFVASGALVVASGASLRLAKKNERLVALVPLFFAIQQAVEGMQWLTSHQSTQGIALGYAYLFFAFLLWPTYIPFAVYYMETEEKSKKVLRWLMGIGVVVTLGLLVLLFANPLQISERVGNIIYTVFASTPLIIVGSVLYTLAIIGPLLASSRRGLRVFGIIVFASEIAAALFFWSGFVSVWCFFSAVLSGGIYFCIRSWNKK